MQALIFGLRVGGIERVALQLRHSLLQARLAGASDVHLAPQRLHDFADLARDAPADIGELLLDRLALGVQRPEPGPRIGLLAQEIGFLLAQVLNQRRGEHIGGGRRRSAVALERHGLRIFCLARGAVGARGAELGVEIVELL